MRPRVRRLGRTTPTPAPRRPRPSGFLASRGSPGRGRGRCGPRSQVLVVHAIRTVRTGTFHLRDGLVEILAHLAVAHLLSHLLCPARHAAGVVLVDVGKVTVAEPVQPAVLREDLGGPRAQAGEMPAAALRARRRCLDRLEALEEDGGPFTAV